MRGQQKQVQYHAKDWDGARKIHAGLLPEGVGRHEKGWKQSVMSQATWGEGRQVTAEPCGAKQRGATQLGCGQGDAARDGAARGNATRRDE